LHGNHASDPSLGRVPWSELAAYSAVAVNKRTRASSTYTATSKIAASKSRSPRRACGVRDGRQYGQQRAWRLPLPAQWRWSARSAGPRHAGGAHV